jgi:Protein of unknown function (DUF2950)
MKCTRKISEIVPYSLFTAITGAQLILLLACWTALSFGQSLNGQSMSRETFSSAEKASTALFAAVQSDDEAAIARVVGGDKDLVSSGDGLTDNQDRKQFLGKYRQMHRLVEEPDGTTQLYIGAENWPFPVPLVSRNDKWFFDADAGNQEVRFRRIGENETYSLETCVALSGSEQPPSDISHGYYFRKLSEKKSGGAKEVIFIAYPAEYRSSGVVTFVVTSNHEVFKKDLGAQTATIAKKMSTLKVNHSWHRAE